MRCLDVTQRKKRKIGNHTNCNSMKKRRARPRVRLKSKKEKERKRESPRAVEVKMAKAKVKKKVKGRRQKVEETIVADHRIGGKEAIVTEAAHGLNETIMVFPKFEKMIRDIVSTCAGGSKKSTMVAINAHENKANVFISINHVEMKPSSLY